MHGPKRTTAMYPPVDLGAGGVAAYDAEAPVIAAAETIPFRLRVGVSGHRRLTNAEELRRSVAHVLDEIPAYLPAHETPVTYRVVSPLAEGADRLVAGCVLSRADADLMVSLPFNRERYMEDFADERSRAEFQELYESAVFHTVAKSHGGLSDEECYELGGQEVVEHSDVLIALWDGLPARGAGGTAAIVEYARGGTRAGIASERHRRGPSRSPGERRIPVFVVRTDRAGVVESLFEDGDWSEVRSAYKDLHHFNRLRPPGRALRKELARNESELQAGAAAFGEKRQEAKTRTRFHEVTLSLEGWLFPVFVKADTAATSFRNKVLGFGVATAVFAAAAVAAAAARVVYAPRATLLTWIEVLLMATVVAGRLTIVHQRAHRRWVTLRALAEMLRVMPYSALADPRHFTAGNGDERGGSHAVRPPTVQLEWYRRTVDELWRRRPRITLTQMDVPWLRTLILQRWIAGQIDYHTRRGQHHRLWHRLLRGGVLAAFVGTLVCALAHALGDGGTTTAFLTVALPAAGGALSYIEAHREHGRHAERYTWTVNQLRDLQRRGEHAEHVGELRLIARRMFELMNTENADWAEVMWVHDVELAV
ncbi:MAG: SLATT domain-containing protein [Solirubrobacteraceae bacterium]